MYNCISDCRHGTAVLTHILFIIGLPRYTMSIALYTELEASETLAATAVRCVGAPPTAGDPKGEK